MDGGAVKTQQRPGACPGIRKVVRGGGGNI